MMSQLSETGEQRGAEHEAIMQLHLAEYQALTTRITYWITLQYSTPAITGGALLLLAGTRGLFPPVFSIWAATIIIEVGIGAYFYTIYEMMNNAKYIECELKPKILTSTSRDSFWSYERYRKGNHVYSPAGIYIMTLPSIGLPFVALWLHWLYWRPLSWGDFVGGVISGVVAIFAVMIAVNGSRAQGDLWECAVSEYQREVRPTQAVERTDPAPSRGPAAHRQ
jgi:hypothetical protein